MTSASSRFLPLLALLPVLSAAASEPRGLPERLAELTAPAVHGTRPAAPPSPRDIVENYVVLPTTANNAGAFGALFRTRASVTNPTGASRSVKATFLAPEGATEQTARTATFPLGAGQTRNFDNLTQELFSVQGPGGVVFEMEGDGGQLLLSAEVYAEGPAGRFSTPVPPSTLRNMLGSGYADLSTGVRVDASNRASVGCSNASSGSAVVRVGIYGPDGAKAGEVSLAVPALGWVQAAVPFPVAGGTAAFLTNGGEVYCYAVVVNNSSNDGTVLERRTYLP